MMMPQQRPHDFDPNGVGQANGQLFGLPFTTDTAGVVLVPVPWDVTVSYREGTASGPEAILEASPQLDFYDPKIPQAWNIGIALEEIDRKWAKKSKQLRKASSQYIQWLEAGSPENDAAEMEAIRLEINEKCGFLFDWVKARTAYHLEKGKLVGVLGGDHSTPLGLMHALADRHTDFGILQIDAHMDLRDTYEGFENSHASIMFNALKIPQISKLVQVGIRDYCEAEARLAAESQGRVVVFYDRQLANAQFEGQSWKKSCAEIVKALPDKVYVSFDIDGLDPKLCPGTGTPVPGGMEFEQAMYLIEQVAASGRKIIGFDLCEVAPRKKDDWDANVGARVLYRLANLAYKSHDRKFTKTLV